MNYGQRFLKQTQSISSEAWKCMPLWKLFLQTQLSLHRGSDSTTELPRLIPSCFPPCSASSCSVPLPLFISPACGRRGDLFIRLPLPSSVWADLTVLLTNLFCSRDLELITQTDQRAGCSRGSSIFARNRGHY